MQKFRIPILVEALTMAVQALRAQLLRAVLTALIIAIGITALVGMLTATSVMESSISGQFTSMGANTFTIQQGGMNIQIGRRGMREKEQPQIPLRTAIKLRENLDAQGVMASVSDDLMGTAVIFYEGKETNPNVRVMAADKHYPEVNALELAEGRYFSPIELNEARAVALIAPDVAAKLFPNGGALGKRIRISGNKPYTVIGVTKPKGNSGFMASDNIVYLPLMTGHQDFGTPYSSYVTSIMAPDALYLDATIDQATAAMRAIRKLRPGEENNFNIRRSDSLSAILIESCQYGRGPHRLHYPAGGIRGADEHHARLRDRTHPRDRHPQSTGRQPAHHRLTIPVGSRSRFPDRRPDGHGPWTCRRQRHGRFNEFSCGFPLKMDDLSVDRFRFSWHCLRVVPRASGGSIGSDRSPTL